MKSSFLTLSLTWFLCTLGLAEERVKEWVPLTIAALEAKGVPQISGKWTQVDYDQAAQTLAKIAVEAPQSLPRTSDQEAGKVFRLMIDTQREGIRQEATTKERRDRALRVSANLNTLLKAYSHGHVRGFNFDREAALLSNRILHTSADVVEFQEILAKDSDEDRRILSQLGNAIAPMIDGSISILADPTSSKEDCLILFTALMERRDRLYPTLTDQHRARIAQHVEMALKQKPHDSDLKQIGEAYR